jgi:hypothetical protein
MPLVENARLHSLNPVAIKEGQTEVNAPEHETWGKVTCGQCGEVFLVGPNCNYADPTQKTRYMKKFEQMLADEHMQEDRHQNSYDLGW